MPEGVRAHTLVRERRADALGLDDMFLENIPNPEACEGRIVGVEKDLLATRIAGRTLLEISPQGLGRFGPERATEARSSPQPDYRKRLNHVFVFHSPQGRSAKR